MKKLIEVSTAPKDVRAWLDAPMATLVYEPENGDGEILTKKYFVDLCKGNQSHAYHLFCLCEWQHPSTIITEFGGLEELFAGEVVHG